MTPPILLRLPLNRWRFRIFDFDQKLRQFIEKSLRRENLCRKNCLVEIAGMMASRLMHRREHVIPALTDHLEDEGGVIGLQIEGRVGVFLRPVQGF